MTVRSTEASRGFVILLVVLLTLLLFGLSLKSVVRLGLHDDRYLQIVVAPFACCLLLFWERTRIFSRANSSPQGGIWLLSVSALMGVLAVSLKPGGEDGAVLAILAMILLWMGAFLFCCGFDSFRAAIYPLCCLFLMIPLPSSCMDRAAQLLQHASAATSYGILRMTAIPVLRHGMVFSLPGLDFEVAPECSGIHSSLALMMVAIVAGFIFLGSGWSRAALIALTVPIAIIKNSIRIAAIAFLAARVDRWFIDGPFHHRYGGLVFSAVAVVFFVLLLAGLQKIEKWRAGRNFSPRLD